VRALDYQDGWIYAGGNFTHVNGGDPIGSPVTVGKLIRVRATDGQPDGQWKPVLNGSVIDLDASDAGDRVYVAGHFTTVSGAARAKFAILGSAIGAPVITLANDWIPSTSVVASQYQQTVREVGDDVWLGGSQHILSRYRRGDMARLNSNITFSGGDLQAIAVLDGVVYATCHCDRWELYGGRSWPANPAESEETHAIRFIGAWDAATGRYLPEFLPSALKTRSGSGGWELYPDPNGCLWFGGDFTRGTYRSGAYQWLGGFGKFCRRDRTPPSPPSGLSAASGAGGSTVLTWAAATDNDRVASYVVYRGDRPIGTTMTPSFTDISGAVPATFRVRAIDPTGNQSATSQPLDVMSPPVSLVSATATWAWVYAGASPPFTWNQPGFDDSGWARGAAELGFGDGDEATVIRTSAAPHPITAYFRTTFAVPDPSQLTSLTLNLVRDDGAVVYVNGVEVARSNMPAGPVSGGTLAATGVSVRADEQAVHTVTVPASALVAGTNTVAVEVHQFTGSSGDLSFRLGVTGNA
jgi:hypothetical protein